MQKIMKVAGFALLVAGTASMACAAVPEIDPASTTNAIALVAGAILIIRSRKR